MYFSEDRSCAMMKSEIETVSGSERETEAEMKYLDTVGVMGEIRCHTVFWAKPQWRICQATELTTAPAGRPNIILPSY